MLGLTFMFTRYFIYLQPVVSLMLIVNSYVLLEMFAHDRRWAKKIIRILLSVIVVAISFNAVRNADLISGKVYEAFHQYRGPLDHAIPYIREHLASPADLVIATNYEETSYMFYLGSRTILGFIGNNLADDLKLRPDVMIVRKNSVSPAFNIDYRKIFSDYLQKDRYARVVLPIFDLAYNTVPQTEDPCEHSFRTNTATDEKDRLVMFIREGSLAEKGLRP
jgi:hypothetical protein